jgi:TolB protein
MMLSFALLSALLLTPSFPPPGNEPTRVLEERDVENAYPRWSADGKRILFQSNVSGRWQLYVMNEKGSDVTQLTRDSSNNNFPDWSPDNARIAFVSDRTGNEEVFVMDSDGKNVRRLTFDRGRDIHPYWTPDGSGILFNSTMEDSTAFDIYEMKPDGSAVRRVLKSPDDETCARLSPGLDKMVYLKNNASGLDDLFMMDLKDRTETNLTNTPTTDGWPCWMPGGKQVVFSAIEEGRYKLFVYDLAGKSLKKLTEPPAKYDDGRANVSSDGKKIVFNRQINGRKNTIGIYVLRLD